jgi:hypothetical protein
MNYLALLRISAVAFSLLFATASYAQTNSKTVVVRAYEEGASRNLFISYGPDKTEHLNMRGMNGDKEQQRVTEQLQGVIERLYNEGYTLKGTTSGGTQDRFVSTYIFRKE